ncbi:hypothetical protein JTB14_008291 [Gonioctena quinquepunctata]|nr:hypothetical protein JTB14_008291 [Gonioctena quinquepunctata]
MNQTNSKTEISVKNPGMDEFITRQQVSTAVHSALTSTRGRRQPTRCVIGTNKSQPTLKTVPKMGYLHVSRLHPDMTDLDLTKFVEATAQHSTVFHSTAKCGRKGNTLHPSRYLSLLDSSKMYITLSFGQKKLLSKDLLSKMQIFDRTLRPSRLQYYRQTTRGI